MSVVQGLVELGVGLRHNGVDIKARSVEVKLVTGPGVHGGGNGQGLAVDVGDDGVGKIGAVVFQGLLQGDAGAKELEAKAGAQHGDLGANAKEGDVGAGAKRQAAAVGGLVLHQDGALGRLLAVEVDGLLDDGVGVARAVGVKEVLRRLEGLVEGLGVGALGGELLAHGAQVGVERGAKLLHNAARAHGGRKAQGAHAYETAARKHVLGFSLVAHYSASFPFACMFLEVLMLRSFPCIPRRFLARGAKLAAVGRARLFPTRP